MTTCKGCGLRHGADLSCQQAETRRAHRDLKRLRRAIMWALGYTSFRPREEGEGAYWWRTELRKRCGTALSANARLDRQEEAR